LRTLRQQQQEGEALGKPQACSSATPTSKWKVNGTQSHKYVCLWISTSWIKGKELFSSKNRDEKVHNIHIFYGCKYVLSYIHTCIGVMLWKPT
jgi:hypothetical protein